MTRETDLEIANYQDAWAKLYLHLAKAVVRDFGIDGERLLRQAVSSASTVAWPSARIILPPD